MLLMGLRVVGKIVEVFQGLAEAQVLMLAVFILWQMYTSCQWFKMLDMFKVVH